ncbi:hypothetical protein CANINC_001058 [Pichia inconspicua]|uniref:Uncharacterized protein n=1 Tax=Pichia inconspicua TaxID=52247 RepID=A0A4T0X4I5_9ASCO|nr:hypothetical protein CANINC_001058 [[Candida] inconspicua]
MMSFNKNNFGTNLNENEIWSYFSSIKQSKDFNEANLDSTWGTILPPSSRFHDLVLYLQEQEQEIISSKLDGLVKEHETFLINGDVRLNQTRNNIFNAVTSLCTGVDSMQEIFQSLLNGKLEKYNLFNDWEFKRQNIESEVRNICQDSIEGKNYQSLLAESRSMELDIKRLEEKLHSLKAKKNLIDRQVQESKSLVDIKLNKFKDKLNSLLLEEETEVSLLFQEKQISSDSLQDTDVKKALEADIEKIKPFLHELSDKKTQVEKLKICLKDVFDTLSSTESTMFILLKEEKTEQLDRLLNSTRMHLLEILNLVQKCYVPYSDKLVSNEISAIEKGINLIHSREANSSKEISEAKLHSNYKEPTLDTDLNEADMSKLISPSPPKASPAKPTTLNFTVSSTSNVVNNLNLDTKKEKFKEGISFLKGEKKD